MELDLQIMDNVTIIINNIIKCDIIIFYCICDTCFGILNVCFLMPIELNRVQFRGLPLGACSKESLQAGSCRLPALQHALQSIDALQSLVLGLRSYALVNR